MWYTNTKIAGLADKLLTEKIVWKGNFQKTLPEAWRIKYNPPVMNNIVDFLKSSECKEHIKQELNSGSYDIAELISIIALLIDLCVDNHELARNVPFLMDMYINLCNLCEKQSSSILDIMKIKPIGARQERRSLNDTIESYINLGYDTLLYILKQNAPLDSSIIYYILSGKDIAKNKLFNTKERKEFIEFCLQAIPASYLFLPENKDILYKSLDLSIGNNFFKKLCIYDDGYKTNEWLCDAILGAGDEEEQSYVCHKILSRSAAFVPKYFKHISMNDIKLKGLMQLKATKFAQESKHNIPALSTPARQEPETIDIFKLNQDIKNLDGAMEVLWNLLTKDEKIFILTDPIYHEYSLKEIQQLPENEKQYMKQEYDPIDNNNLSINLMTLSLLLKKYTVIELFKIIKKENLPSMQSVDITEDGYHTNGWHFTNFNRYKFDTSKIKDAKGDYNLNKIFNQLINKNILWGEINTHDKQDLIKQLLIDNNYQQRSSLFQMNNIDELFDRIQRHFPLLAQSMQIQLIDNDLSASELAMQFADILNVDVSEFMAGDSIFDDVQEELDYIRELQVERKEETPDKYVISSTISGFAFGMPPSADLTILKQNVLVQKVIEQERWEDKEILEKAIQLGMVGNANILRKYCKKSPYSIVNLDNIKLYPLSDDEINGFKAQGKEQIKAMSSSGAAVWAQAIKEGIVIQKTSVPNNISEFIINESKEIGVDQEKIKNMLGSTTYCAFDGRRLFPMMNAADTCLVGNIDMGGNWAGLFTASFSLTNTPAIFIRTDLKKNSSMEEALGISKQEQIGATEMHEGSHLLHFTSAGNIIFDKILTSVQKDEMSKYFSLPTELFARSHGDIPYMEQKFRRAIMTYIHSSQIKEGIMEEIWDMVAKTPYVLSPQEVQETSKFYQMKHPNVNILEWQNNFMESQKNLFMKAWPLMHNAAINILISKLQQFKQNAGQQEQIMYDKLIYELQTGTSPQEIDAWVNTLLYGLVKQYIYSLFANNLKDDKINRFQSGPSESTMESANNQYMTPPSSKEVAGLAQFLTEGAQPIEGYKGRRIDLTMPPMLMSAPEGKIKYDLKSLKHKKISCYNAYMRRLSAKRGTMLGNLPEQIYALYQEMKMRIDKYAEWCKENDRKEIEQAYNSIPNEWTWVQNYCKKNGCPPIGKYLTEGNEVYKRIYGEAQATISEKIDKILSMQNPQIEFATRNLKHEYSEKATELITNSGIFQNPVKIFLPVFTDTHPTHNGIFIRHSNERNDKEYLPGGHIRFFNEQEFTPQMIAHELTHAADSDKTSLKKSRKNNQENKDNETPAQKSQRLRKYYNRIQELRARTKEIVMELKHVNINNSNIIDNIHQTKAWRKMEYALTPDSRRIVYTLVYNNIFN